MATPRKRNPRNPGPTKDFVLTPEEFKIISDKLGPLPANDDLDIQMLWLARRAQLTVLNKGTRDSLIVAEKIIKASKEVVGVKAPPGKTETLAASTPVRRAEEK